MLIAHQIIHLYSLTLSEDVDGSLLESLANAEELDVSGRDMAFDDVDSINTWPSRPQTLSLGTTAVAASNLVVLVFSKLFSAYSRML